MRKIISLLLALCLVVGMVPVAASATETSLPEPDNGVITLNSDVNLTQSYNVEKGKTVVLDLHGYDMVVNVESYTYLDDARIFQFTSSRHRPDKFRFKDFARRMKTV